MDSGFRPLGKLALITYTIPIVPVMSIPYETGPMVMVSAEVLLGIILPMVVVVTILPMAIVEASPLMTMPAILFIIWGDHCGDCALMGSVALVGPQGL